MNLWGLIGLASGTLVSEDLATIGAGLLARDGRITIGAAIAACCAGVYLGDLGLWAAGRTLGRRALRLRWVASRLDEVAWAGLCEGMDARLPLAVIGSRFLPGSRLPMYLAAGIWGRRPAAFMAWSLIAVLLWTPLLVLLSAAFGEALAATVVGRLGAAVHFVVAGAVVFTALRLAARRLTRRSASRLFATLRPLPE